MSKTLEERYVDILKDVDPSFLDSGVAKTRKLSTPFLVNGPKDSRSRKIMVVGREFGGNGWYVPYDGSGPMAYVTSALEKHRNFFDNCMKEERDGKITFFNFMRRLGERLGHGGLIYSNLLCFDSVGQDPRKSEHFDLIKDISKRLLDAQIDFFRPDVIVFANGMSTVKIRREFFPISGKNKVCVGRRNWQDVGIHKDHLWEFELREQFLCYRIQHPANWRAPGRSQGEAARRKLLELLTQPQQVQ